MGNSIADYTFTVIKDNPVPLAASFESFSYAPVIMAVVAALIVAAVVLYSVWFYMKSLRLSSYGGMTLSNVVKEFYIHPFRLTEAGRELDHRMLGRNVA